MLCRTANRDYLNSSYLVRNILVCKLNTDQTNLNSNFWENVRILTTFWYGNKKTLKNLKFDYVKTYVHERRQSAPKKNDSFGAGLYISSLQCATRHQALFFHHTMTLVACTFSSFSLLLKRKIWQYGKLATGFTSHFFFPPFPSLAI